MKYVCPICGNELFNRTSCYNDTIIVSNETIGDKTTFEYETINTDYVMDDDDDYLYCSRCNEKLTEEDLIPFQEWEAREKVIDILEKV